MILADPVIDGAAGGHVVVEADVVQRMAARQAGQDPIGELGAVKGFAAVPRVADGAGAVIAGGEFAKPDGPSEHRVVDRHAVVAAYIVQRSAALDLARDVIGEFGGVLNGPGAAPATDIPGA
jgi:hypothetical protein